eukprot:3933934-Rhodomonas_salina.1
MACSTDTHGAGPRTRDGRPSWYSTRMGLAQVSAGHPPTSAQCVGSASITPTTPAGRSQWTLADHRGGWRVGGSPWRRASRYPWRRRRRGARTPELQTAAAPATPTPPPASRASRHRNSLSVCALPPGYCISRELPTSPSLRTSLHFAPSRSLPPLTRSMLFFSFHLSLSRALLIPSLPKPLSAPSSSRVSSDTATASPFRGACLAPSVPLHGTWATQRAQQHRLRTRGPGPTW